MAKSLLELVDLLVGDLLAGNIYTNVDTYTKALKSPLQSPTGINHPHRGSNVILPPPHDNRPDFLDPTPRTGLIAAQTPAGKRASIYAPETPRPDVGQQINSSKRLDPKIPRDEIYSKQSGPSQLRTHGPLSDLLDFHDSKVHPHEGKVIPNAPSAPYADPPGYFNKTGLHPSQHGIPPNPPATPENYDQGSTPLRNWDNVESTSRDQIYQGAPPPDVIDQKSKTSDLASRATAFPPGTSPQFQKEEFLAADRTDIYKNPNSNVGGTSVSKPTAGDLLNAQGQPSPTPDIHKEEIKSDSSFAKGQAFDNARRNDIYKNPNSNVGGTPFSKETLGDVSAKSSLPPTPQKIFNKPEEVDYSQFTPHTIQTQGFRQQSREEIYLDKDSAGIPRSPLGRPPVVPLGQVTSDTGRTDFSPTQGQIKKEFSEAHRLGNLYDDGSLGVGSRGGPYSVSSFVPLKGFDVFAIAHWFRNIGREFGVLPIQDNNDQNKVQRPGEMIAKGITFVASNFLLASLNPGDTQSYGIGNQIFNPLALLSQVLPLRVVDGIPLTHVTFGTSYKESTLTSETIGTSRLLLMRDGAYVKNEIPHALAQLRSPDAGFVGDLTKVGEHDSLDGGPSALTPSTIASQVDGGVKTESARFLGLHTNVYTSEEPYSAKDPQHAVLPLQKLEEQLSPAFSNGGIQKLNSLFDAKTFPGGETSNKIGEVNPGIYTWVAKPDSFRIKGFGNLVDAPGINAAVTDAALNQQDQEDGTLKEQIDDDQIYMPFMFEDLRDNLENGSSKFLYFRAFLKEGLTETFVPDWQVEQYYGRVDSIPVYKGTIRNLNVSFDIVAWSPKDLPVIYKKLQKLQSMVYPEYDLRGFLSKGPIIRMRIGDLFAGKGKKGIPGYITALDLSYDDGIWNIEADTKVPRKISVSLGYTVIHDGNPGIYPYASADISPDGNVSVATEGRTFGAGTFFAGDVTTVTVSDADIRKIFQTVRNK